MIEDILLLLGTTNIIKSIVSKLFSSQIWHHRLEKDSTETLGTVWKGMCEK